MAKLDPPWTWLSSYEAKPPTPADHRPLLFVPVTITFITTDSQPVCHKNVLIGKKSIYFFSQTITNNHSSLTNVGLTKTFAVILDRFSVILLVQAGRIDSGQPLKNCHDQNSYDHRCLICLLVECFPKFHDYSGQTLWFIYQNFVVGASVLEFHFRDVHFENQIWWLFWMSHSVSSSAVALISNQPNIVCTLVILCAFVVCQCKNTHCNGEHSRKQANVITIQMFYIHLLPIRPRDYHGFRNRGFLSRIPKCKLAFFPKFSLTSSEAAFETLDDLWWH